MAKMWAGRTDGNTDKLADDFNSSIHFDCRMYRQDITGSMAHAAMLAATNIITDSEADALICGLEQILADLESGALTDERAIELLEHIFIRLEGDVVNICIGGQNAQGECQINGLSRCILRAVRSCNVPGPNLSLRYTQNTPDEFFDECLETIGTGLGYPAIMNDDVNVAALKKYGYAEGDVYNYSMVACP